MTHSNRTSTNGADGELDEALAQDDDAKIVLAEGEKRYLILADPDDLWANYDPEAARAALREIAGIITPEEADRMIEMIYRAREEGTRPIDRSKLLFEPNG